MNAGPPAFAKEARRRSNGTAARVAAAIAKLQAEGKRVSLRAITAADRALNPATVPLAETTITRNDIARKLYDAASPAKKRRARRPRAPDARLERKTKAELVDIIHERNAYIAQLERCLDANAFGDPEGD